jgi:tripartite-type tricarboxylate transporter receptor subunit TctC
VASPPSPPFGRYFPLRGKIKRRGTLGFALALPAVAWGQERWPSRPVRVVHGYDAGSNPDVIARQLQPAMSEMLGQQIVVDPKPGAAERVAAALVAKQPADGYTLYLMTGGQAVVSATDAALPYDLLRDFSFITTVTRFPFVIIVAAGSPLASMADVLVRARAQPGKLTYGSSGIGSTLHLAMELFCSRTGIQLTHVPYRGQPGQPLSDLTEGRLDMHVITFTGAQAHIDAGRMRGLAVTSKERHKRFPAVPSLSETVPDYDVSSWLGFTAPAGLPQPIVERLVAVVAEAARRPDVTQRLETMGNEIHTGTPDQFRARVADDLAKWRPFAQLVRQG